MQEWIKRFVVVSFDLDTLVTDIELHIYRFSIIDFSISFASFGVFFQKITTVKNFFSGGVTSPPPCGGSIAPIHTKIMYDLTIAIINKCFEFQNDWLKMIPIRYNCTQFSLIPLC